MKMKMKSSIMCVFLLILVLLEMICCQGCWKHEREALLALNAQFDHYTSDWIDNTDCCKWEYVKCNTTTWRVEELELDQVMYSDWYINYSDFLVFEDLKSLNLSYNSIVGCVGHEGLRLSNLEVIDLSHNVLNNTESILSCLDGLSSLKSLDLSENGFDETSHHVLEALSSKLLNLEVLLISGNNFNGSDVASSLGGLQHLKHLDLSHTNLEGSLNINVEELDLELVMYSGWNINYSDFLVFEDLKSLDLSDNSIAGCVGHEGLRLSNLEVIDLSYNRFNGTSLSCLDGLSSLKSLDLSHNGFNETLLYDLEALSSKLLNLEALLISGNNFNGSDVPSFLGGLQRLKHLDLSDTHLEGSLNISGLLGLSNLEILDLDYNNISNFVVHQGSKSLSKVEVLNLAGNKMDGNMLQKSLRAFSLIRELDLSDNQFKGTIVAADFRDLGNLEHLVLDNSSLVNVFFKSIGMLTSLKVLSLVECNINGTLPAADWSKLTKLEELDLSINEFEGPLPSSFCNMTSLWKLDLSSNYFVGNFGSNIESLTSLEYLAFDTGNQFEFPISFTPFANNSNIKFIYGNGNKVILDSHSTLQTWVPKFQLQELYLSSTTETNHLPLPNFLLYQYNLSYLDFNGCKLEGDFPKWLLENNTKITDLFLRNCSFTGTFQMPSRPLLSLEKIDVSENAITGQIPSNNISSIFPKLQVLVMSVNDIHGSIPHEFGQMSLLKTLDLSDNHLFGEIPRNISGAGSLSFLRLSNNKLDGAVFPTLSTLSNLDYLFLDGNSFSGSIPSSPFNRSSLLTALDLSNNCFMGKLPSGWNQSLSSLETLSMSNNHFEGSIPSKFAELENLRYLDLSQNKLTGSVPSFLIPLRLNVRLSRFIHLNNNKLSGLPKRMFNKSSSVLILDLSYNHITSDIQDMVQALIPTGLKILLLKGNQFTGQIPKQICQLTNITILDLSHNNFTGPIPNCLGEMSFENNDDDKFEFEPAYYTSYLSEDDKLSPMFTGKASFTTKKSSYPYTGSILIYMAGIDLSFNKLNGSIPFELGKLTKIRAMNLSYNDLSGKIPATFSNLVQVESLDLSFNKLSGSIPPQLNELTFLEVFSVAHNNLSGAIPEMKQFWTFNESSYEGNPLLCGLPLTKSCNPFSLPNGSYTNGDSDSLVDIYVFWVSFVVSYTSILLAIAAVLYINPYWRRAWFYYIGLVSTNCYYFIEDNLRKFSINI